jgi:hypothetical protein
MSEERLEQDESKETQDDVEAHKVRVRMGNDEPAAEDESDDVEAHARRADHKNL